MREGGREAERQRGREAERQRGREAERQRGREAERQRGREAERLQQFRAMLTHMILLARETVYQGIGKPSSSLCKIYDHCLGKMLFSLTLNDPRGDR